MKIILPEQVIGEKVQSEHHPVTIETMRVIAIFTIFFLWILQTSPAQTAPAGSMKVYITWIRIKAEKEKKSRLNFNTNDAAVLLPCIYKKSDFLSNRFVFPTTEDGNISLVQIRNRSGAGKDALADDFMIDLYVGKRIEYAGDFDGVTDVQSLVIDGAAAMAGTIILAAVAGASGGNTELNLSKAHVHRREPPPAKKNETQNSLSFNGLQLNENLAALSFSPLRDTVVDIDGNIYHTAALGAIVIMTENLRVTHFSDGKEILKMNDTADLTAVHIPAYFNYKSDSGISTGKEMLYNWHVVIDTSRVCPKDWHVPSYSEWTSLVNCLGGTRTAAGKLMKNFAAAGKVSNWWSSTVQDAGHAQSFSLDPGAMEAGLTITARNFGLPVRCIRNY